MNAPRPPSPNPQIRVFLACSGLGHVNRGFETFTHELDGALRRDDRLDVTLFKGAGASSDEEISLGCLKRTGWPARMLGGLYRDSYYIEQASFALSLTTWIRKRRPAVIMFSDGVIGSTLWRWKRMFGGDYRLLLSNSGPLGPPAFPRFDHVHQVASIFYEESAQAGRSAESQTLIPFGFQIPQSFSPPSDEEKRSLRVRLELPAERSIVITVGAINRGHKRMDHLIREISAIPEARPFLLMLGNRETDTPGIEALARENLGADGFRMDSVPGAEIAQYYRAADVFALASLREGFGRVYVEALAAGLPCVVHEGAIQREVLGDLGRFVDASRDGEFARAVGDEVAASRNVEEARCRAVARHGAVYDRYSWDSLTPRYVDMIVRCATQPLGATK